MNKEYCYLECEMISGAYRVLHLHAEGGGVEHHDGIPAVQIIIKLVTLFIIL
jgi:hypothetical protein